MRSGEVLNLLKKTFVESLSIGTSDPFSLFSEKAIQLSEKLSKLNFSEEDVLGYVDFIIDYMDSLNEFFRKNGRGRIQYSRFFSFALKEEKLQEFVFERGVLRRREKALRGDKSVGMAGYSEKKGDGPEASTVYKDEIYGCVFSSEKELFLFSPKSTRMIVQKYDGEIMSYKAYKKKNKGEKGFVSLVKIYNNLRNKDKSSIGETSAAFLIFARQVIAKYRRKKALMSS